MEQDLLSDQNRPEVLRLLAASLRCDQRSRQYQAAYAGVIVVGPVLLFFGNGLSPVVNDLAGLVQGSAAVVALALGTSWRQRGSDLRADFERHVFGFPPWVSESRLKSERVAALASLYERHTAAAGRLRNWFDLPLGLSRDQQVLASMHQSVRYGQALRTAWAAILGALGVLLATLVVLLLVRTRPTSAGGWHLAIIAAALLSTLVAQAVKAWRYSRDRGWLRQTIEALSRRPNLDLATANLVVHERLVALRNRRILVPTVLYRLSRGPLRRATIEKMSLFLTPEAVGTAE